MAAISHKLRLTAAESFWYVLGCIAFGSSYFAKVPVKKALSDAGLAQMTGAEQFWYVLQCIAFGAGYFAKIPAAKALTEMTRFPVSGSGPQPGPAGPPQLGQRAQLDQPSQPDIWRAGQVSPATADPQAGRHGRREVPGREFPGQPG